MCCSIMSIVYLRTRPAGDVTGLPHMWRRRVPPPHECGPPIVLLVSWSLALLVVIVLEIA